MADALPGYLTEIRLVIRKAFRLALTALFVVTVHQWSATQGLRLS